MTRISKRVRNSGVETAFFVARDAAELERYLDLDVSRFDIGDINIPTPDSIKGAAKLAIDSNKTGYTPPGGIIELKEAIAEHINRTREVDYTHLNVSVQPGGKPVIGKFLQSVIDPGDAVLYPVPGYPIYESQIRLNGGRAIPYHVERGPMGFYIDVGEIKFLLENKRGIKVLILNDHHNPTGARLDKDQMEWLAQISNDHDTLVLSDEAYFDINYSSGRPRSIARYDGMKDRTVILDTDSKRRCMTGWRSGRAIGPHDIIEAITRLNVNDESCSPTMIQYAALEAVSGGEEDAKRILKELKTRRDITYRSIRKIDGVDLELPSTTFYLYPDVTEAFRDSGYRNLEEFREAALYGNCVSFCTMEHFGDMPNYEDPEQRFYIRISYSGINQEGIPEGARRLNKFITGDDKLPIRRRSA